MVFHFKHFGDLDVLWSPFSFLNKRYITLMSYNIPVEFFLDFNWFRGTCDFIATQIFKNFFDVVVFFIDALQFMEIPSLFPRSFSLTYIKFYFVFDSDLLINICLETIHIEHLICSYGQDSLIYILYRSLLSFGQFYNMCHVVYHCEERNKEFPLPSRVWINRLPKTDR